MDNVVQIKNPPEDAAPPPGAVYYLPICRRCGIIALPGFHIPPISGQLPTQEELQAADIANRTGIVCKRCDGNDFVFVPDCEIDENYRVRGPIEKG